jgi:DNA-binding HxlR family transcriptional regulator
MYQYAAYCPVAATTTVVGDYWTPLIVRELLYGTTHFNQLVRNLPSISRSLLADRLRKLERAGVVERESTQPNATSYTLTPAGRDLERVIEAMTAWGMQWSNRANPRDLDPTLTICMMKSRLHPPALPEGRIVIEVIARGQGQGRAWIVCDRQAVSLCFDPPGFDVDLHVAGDAAALHEVWLQNTTIRAELRRGAITLEGPRSLTRAFPTWFEVTEG